MYQVTNSSPNLGGSKRKQVILVAMTLPETGATPARQMVKSLAAFTGHYRNSFHTMENLIETPKSWHFLQAGAFDLHAEIRRSTVISCSLQINAKYTVKNPNK